jgi:hypothetical protein
MLSEKAAGRDYVGKLHLTLGDVFAHDEIQKELRRLANLYTADL